MKILICLLIHSIKNALNFSHLFNSGNRVLGKNKLVRTSEKTSLTKVDEREIVCNHEMLIAYGLEGVKHPESRTHSYCPAIELNCCSVNDEQLSFKLWDNKYRNVVERYYEVYLYALQYLLGFSQEAYLLALEYQNSPYLECKMAAQDIIEMNLNVEFTKTIYQVFDDSLKEMREIRKGFYCILCDARSSSKIQDFWGSTNLLNVDSLYLSKQFCEKLVEKTIRASYFSFYYIKRYSENLVNLMNCKSGNTTSIVYDIPLNIKTSINDCFHYRNKYFFYFCESYCEKFHLTKASPVFDGNIVQLKKFVNHVVKYRHQVFKFPRNNLFMDTVTFEEEYLKDFYDTILKDLVFIRPTIQHSMLDKYRMEVVYYGGFDPWISVNSTKYIVNLLDSGSIWNSLALWTIILINL